MRRFQENVVWKSGRFTVDLDGSIWRNLSLGRKRAERRLPSGYLQIKVMVNGAAIIAGRFSPKTADILRVIETYKPVASSAKKASRSLDRRANLE